MAGFREDLTAFVMHNFVGSQPCICINNLSIFLVEFSVFFFIRSFFARLACGKICLLAYFKQMMCNYSQINEPTWEKRWKHINVY